MKKKRGGGVLLVIGKTAFAGDPYERRVGKEEGGEEIPLFVISERGGRRSHTTGIVLIYP